MTYTVLGSYKIKETERIIIKMLVDADGNLKVPIAGYSVNNTIDCAYDWQISVDGSTYTRHSGTGSKSAIIVATGLTPNSKHTIKIKPTTISYQWARAFGFNNSGIANFLTEIIYDGSYIGYGVSATDTGNYFRAYQYRGCTSLTTAATEVLPDSVTSIGESFRSLQYSNCTSLTTAPNEVLSNVVTDILKNFRYFQYSNCQSLTTAATEALPNTVTSIGDDFRNSQYYNCQSLTTAATEVLPNTVTSIGDNFRIHQYRGCSSLTSITGIQSTQSSVTKGTMFRYIQFKDSGNSETPLTAIINGTTVEVGYDDSLSLNNNNVYQIKVDPSLVSDYQNSLAWSVIDDSKFISI